MSRIALWLSTAIVALALGGCATPIPLNNLTYPGAVTVKTSKSAEVKVVTGAVRGGSGTTMLPAGGILVPISSGPIPKLQFNSVDQEEFGESLRAELVRLGMTRAASSKNPDADIAIAVLFAQTYHNPSLQVYTLDVVVQITGGDQPAVHQYRVISNEGDSFWEKMNTDAYEGKAKAARLLLGKIIPDVEEYLRANPGMRRAESVNVSLLDVRSVR